LFSFMACLAVLNGCSAIDRGLKKFDTADWSGSNPSSIPHEKRLQQYKRGNLVPNPSFEKGRVITNDPGSMFTLKGWEKVGQNVAWINQQADAEAVQEVGTGRHAVKIVRKKAGELDDAEGDVPDRTRYVRLFFGLKGSGAMWLEDIVFRYSKWNFTALERFTPYFDRPLPLEESIVPTPKNIQKLNDIVFYDLPSARLNLPLIVLPENPAAAEQAAAKILQQRIRELICAAVPAEKTRELRIRIIKQGFGRQ
jgi:hypothetical protein